MPKWSCEETNGQKRCRNAHGCHCAEIEALQIRVKKAEERGIVVGVALACTAIQHGHDCPTAVADALKATNLNRAKMKRAGVSDYDLRILRPVFAELR